MIRSWLYNINKKYDSVKEPNRFFLFMGMMMPGLILSFSDNVPVSFVGMAYLLIMLAIRALFIHGKLKNG